MRNEVDSKKRVCTQWAALLVTALCVLAAVQANAAYEVFTAYENAWGDDGLSSCFDSSLNRDGWDDIAMAFKEALEDQSPYSPAYSVTNSELYSSRFSDPNFYSYATDFNYFDSADIGFLITHGGINSSNEFRAAASRQNVGLPGYANNYCDILQEDMYYGDNGGTYGGDMEYFIFAGCNGLHYCTCFKWEFTYELHGIMAFHGDTALSSADNDRIEQFVSDGFDESVSDAWFSNLRWDNGPYSFCPVTVTGADTVEHAQDFMFDEQFYPLFDDKPPGDKKVRRKFSSCDPGLSGASSGYDYYNTDCG